MSKKISTKKIKIKVKKVLKKSKQHLLTFGKLDPQHGRILVLVLLVIFAATSMVISNFELWAKENQVTATTVEVKKINTPLARDIKEMIQGYPMENMTDYIVKQDPQTAMFLVAIAKKESAWGKRHPVLNGQDCFNYWGFRLKSEKMGSGGHTCFDSPKQAVDTVASRIDELVQEENIDNPNKMIVWKCGYGCQSRMKNAEEKKWIKDVGYYYNELLN